VASRFRPRSNGLRWWCRLARTRRRGSLTAAEDEEHGPGPCQASLWTRYTSQHPRLSRQTRALVTVLRNRTCRPHRTQPGMPELSGRCSAAFSGFRVAVRGDLVDSALVPAVRPVRPRCAGVARRARHRGRPPDPVPVGAAVRAAVGRRGSAVPTRGRRPGAGPRRPTRGSPAGGDASPRGVDRFGPVIDVFESEAAGRGGGRFVGHAMRSTMVTPVAVGSDRAAVYPRALDEPAPAGWQRTEWYANNRREADRGRLQRLRTMRGITPTPTPGR